MILNFTKMHGLGNDFVVIDATTTPFKLTPQQIIELSNRHTGIGFDQLLVIEPSQQADVDFNYRIFNADGGEVEHCGNGARCFGKYVRDKGLTNKTSVRVSTMKGIITVTHVEGDLYEVDMGSGTTKPAALPFLPEHTSLIKDDLYRINETSFTPVSVGNPHAVIIVDDINTTFVETIGKQIQAAPAFPNSVNVGFMQVIDNHTIHLRVYERGAGETLACGTGACAAVFAGILHGQLTSPVKVTLRGGELTISVKNGDIRMTGEAKTVFSGTIAI